MVVKEGTLGERYDHRKLASASFGPTEKVRFSVVVFGGEEGGVAVEWFAKKFSSTMIEKWKRGEY